MASYTKNKLYVSGNYAIVEEIGGTTPLEFGLKTSYYNSINGGYVIRDSNTSAKLTVETGDIGDWYLEDGVTAYDATTFLAFLRVNFSGAESTASSKTGNVYDGDYTEIQSDGSIIRHGDASTWDDLVGSLIGRRLSSVSGKVDYDYDENAIIFQPSGDISVTNDCVISNFQYPHKAKVGTGATLNFHIHWEQTSSTDLEFSLKYRVQNNNEAKTTSWTTVVVSTNTNNVFDYDSGTLNQITRLADIDMSGAGISSTVQWKLARTDTETGNILGTFVDAHYEITTDGSRDEFVK